jgi:alkanesulfonate monooxygenase SsuD/methylene tetrahydromethanopterin reductase-like flavin-dependent oxidoreductase (luciferase family)
VQARIPIMVGGVGEKKTLRSVARHADMWNAQLELDEAPHKLEVLREHCADVGRDPAEIELTYNCTVVIRDREAEAQAVLDRQLAHNTLDPHEPRPRFWAGTVESIAERLAGFADAGFHGFTIEEMAPFDDETLVRLIGEVKPLVERG